jgi:acetyl esterase
LIWWLPPEGLRLYAEAENYLEWPMTFVHPEVQAVLDLLSSNPSPPMAELGAPMGRQMFDMMIQMLDRPAEDVPFADTHFAGPGGDVPVRIYQPSAQSDTPRPVVIYYHGGGWVIGNIKSHHSQVSAMAKALGCTIVMPEYRLAPEHPFPAAVDDSLACARWVASSPSEIAHKVSGVAFSGESAGGNLSAVAAQALTSELNVLGQLLLFPSTDFTSLEGSMVAFADGYFLTRQTMDYFEKCYASGQDISNVQISPMKASSLAGQPPAIVMTCALDPLRDQGRAYAQKLINDGVRVSYYELAGHIHSSINMRQAIPSAHAHLMTVCADFKIMIGL